ncbi:MAG: serine hydrolase [Sphingomonas sp.]
MDGAGFIADRTTLIPGRAQSYISIGPGRTITLPSNSETLGASGAWMSTGDLAKWMIYLDQAATQKDPALLAMIQPVQLPGGRTLESGEGIFLSQYRGYAQLFHNGGVSGYRSVAMLFPSQHLGIAIEANSPSDDLVDLAQKIADKFLPSASGPLAPPVAAPASTLKATTKEAVPAPNMTDLAGRYYSEELDTTYTLRIDGDRLFADHIRNPSIELKRVRADAWTGNMWWCKSLVIERGAKRRVTGFRLAGFRSRVDVLFRRV